MKKASDEMPEEFILKRLLVANRTEVKDMLLTEYNEAETMEMFKEEGRAEGRTEGRIEGRTEGHEEEKLLNIRSLMKTLSFTAQQAMDALRISKSEQEEYLSKI